MVNLRSTRPAHWIVAVVVLVAIAGGVRAFVGPAVKVAEATRGELVQTIVSTGRVIPPSHVELGSVMVGTVAAVTVREGDAVKAGHALMRLKDEEQRAALVQARASLAEAEARVVQLGSVSSPVAEQTLKQTEANLALARQEFDRVKRLYDAGYYGKAKLDDAQRTLDTSLAARESALAQAKSNRPQGSDAALAFTRRAQAHAAVDVAEARLANTVIAAPGDGVLLKRLVEPGDVVSQGKKLFEMSVGGETQLLLQVDEKNLGYLKIGQQALASADAYPNQHFAAAVFYIAPSVDVQRGTVEVKLRVADPPAYLRPDMTVSAEIEVGRAKDAVTIDSDAVRDAAGAKSWVMLVADGRTERRDVTLGIRGTGRSQITAGMAAGDVAVLPSEAGIRVGQRVREGSR